MSAHAPATQLVLRARRRWLAARWFEGGCIGCAVAAIQLALLVREGVPFSMPSAWWMAGLAGSFALLSWALEMHESPARFARRLDRGLAAGGALTTAYELERRARPGRLDAVLQERVRTHASGARFVVRPSLSFVAALSLGLAALAWSQEQAPTTAARAVPASGASASYVLERASAALERSLAADEPDPQLGARLAAALELASESSAGAAERAARARALGALELFLERPRPPGEGARLELLARATRERLAATAGSDPTSAGSGGRPGGERAEMSVASDPLALAGEAASRTMSGSTAEAPMPSNPSTPVSELPAGAAPSPLGRWWPRSMDPVVAGYVERTRSAALLPGPDGR